MMGLSGKPSAILTELLHDAIVFPNSSPVGDATSGDHSEMAGSVSKAHAL